MTASLRIMYPATYDLWPANLAASNQYATPQWTYFPSTNPGFGRLVALEPWDAATPIGDGACAQQGSFQLATFVATDNDKGKLIALSSAFTLIWQYPKVGQQMWAGQSYTLISVWEVSPPSTEYVALGMIGHSEEIQVNAQVNDPVKVTIPKASPPQQRRVACVQLALCTTIQPTQLTAAYSVKDTIDTSAAPFTLYTVPDIGTFFGSDGTPQQAYVPSFVINNGQVAR